MASAQRITVARVKNAILRMAAAPVFPGEKEKTRVAGFLKLVIASSVVLTVALLIGSFLGNNVPNAAKAIGVAWLCALMVGWWLMHRGHVSWVATTLTALFFVVITSVNISLGTVRAPIASVYVFWVILTGMLFHRPGILIATAASSLAILGMILAENAGLLPTPNYSVGITQWVNYTVLFILTSGLVYYGNRMADLALARAEDEIEKRRLTESELHRLTRAVEQSPASIVITDLDGAIEYVNPRFVAVTGYSPDEVLGKNPRFLQSGQTPPATYQALWQRITSGQEWRGEFVNQKKDGTVYHESAVISPITDVHGTTTHYMAVREDITERKRSDEALRISEARHRLLADNARDVIWTMAPNGVITYVSPSVEKVRGFTPGEVLQQTVGQIHPPSSQAQAMAYFSALSADLTAGRPVKSFRGQLEYWCKDGSTIWAEVMAHPVLSDGRLVEMIGVTRDISEHKRLVIELQQAKEAAEQANQALLHANAELAKIATTDPLTGIWNRRHFLNVAENLKAQASRYGLPLSLLLLDIDHFKAINDQHGHQAGDQVLIAMTQLMQPGLREADIFARWGGEEFVVLIPHCKAHEAMQLADKLRATVGSHPFAEIGTVTISLGVAELLPNESINDLFKRVDIALYGAKAAGRNRAQLCAANAGQGAPVDLDRIQTI